MELIDRIKQDIDNRLEELRPQVEEIPRLEAVLAALESSGGAQPPSGGSPGRGRPRGGGSGRSGAGGASAGPRRRARRGQRREELLRLIADSPEITIAEAARQMGVSSPQVSTLVRRLEEEGALERSDGRFTVRSSVTSAGEDAAAENGGEHEAPAPERSDSSPATPQEIQGPGVESIAGEEGHAEAESVPEPARDEAGRPPAS